MILLTSWPSDFQNSSFWKSLFLALPWLFVLTYIDSINASYFPSSPFYISSLTKLYPHWDFLYIDLTMCHYPSPSWYLYFPHYPAYILWLIYIKLLQTLLTPLLLSSTYFNGKTTTLVESKLLLTRFLYFCSCYVGERQATAVTCSEVRFMPVGLHVAGQWCIHTPLHIAGSVNFPLS